MRIRFTNKALLDSTINFKKELKFLDFMTANLYTKPDIYVCYKKEINRFLILLNLYKHSFLLREKLAKIKQNQADLFK